VYPHGAVAHRVAQCVSAVVPPRMALLSDSAAADAVTAALALVDTLQHDAATVAVALAALDRIGAAFFPSVRPRAVCAAV
jgi:hypothetical protein